MLSESTLVPCREWNIIQNGRLVVTCANGQYIIVIDICLICFNLVLLMNVECIISFKCNLILPKASNISTFQFPSISMFQNFHLTIIFIHFQISSMFKELLCNKIFFHIIKYSFDWQDIFQKYFIYVIINSLKNIPLSSLVHGLLLTS